ncbi:flagellin N-terminal helical domain-containing protein [Azospirillum isscasi]|uniref:Flagellin N-terminal domain-containing protein n=1 Tax=Azospirillum isscasi TaxID=3053926 RepID=A0ABU0WDX7_9PROT|nr:hypothetical protein [Azospirillum isscasi]MDQ2102403.1 hypothetical protein [Azospirillum isscasi]
MAENNVTLSAGIRTSLLTLQNTSQKQARAHERLASGLKVNTALDNPPAYFAAKSLRNRAEDLTALKDQMAQAISTVKAADKGVEAIGQFAEQAKGLTVTALSCLGNDEASRMTRAALAAQYDQLLVQIDKAAGDSGYRGKNLLNSVKSDYVATQYSKIEALTIPGITKVDVTNASNTGTYKIRVFGDGQISANEESLRDVENNLGLGHFKLFGFSSYDNANIDPIKLTLKRQSGDKATLLIQDGRESQTLDIDLSKAGTTTPSKVFRFGFASGAWVSFTYSESDLADRARATAGAPIEVPVTKDIDLSMEVACNNGQVETKSLNSVNTSDRIRAGENVFSFDDTSLRVNIDVKKLQQASESRSKIVLEGPLAGFITDPSIGNALSDHQFDLSYEETIGDGSGGVPYGSFIPSAYGQYQFFSSTADISLTGSSFFSNNQEIINLPMWPGMSSDPTASNFTAKISSGILTPSHTKSGIHIQTATNNNSSVIPPEGGAGDEFPMGWMNFSTNTTLSIDVAADNSAGSGYRYVNINDTTGSKANLRIHNAAFDALGNYYLYPIQLSGGQNNGANIVIAPSLGPTSTTIDLVASGASAFDHGVYGGGSSQDIRVSNHTAQNVTTPIYVEISNGGADSAGAGFQLITVNPTNYLGIDASSAYTFKLPNGAQSNVPIGFAKGVNGHSKGASFNIDLTGNASTNQITLFPPPDPSSQVPTRVLYRAAHSGKVAEVDVTQMVHATDGNDLVVQTGLQPSSNITIEAKNITTGGTGLAIDRSINSWADRADIDKAVGELDRATQKLRSAGTELSTGLDILSTRETFTKEFSDILSGGADKMILVDQSEEGANLLTLQTRQQLTTSALSLASQSQQAILRLFG